MALTDQNVYDLNMMNEAANRCKLGNLLKSLEDGSSEDSDYSYVLPAATTSTLGGVKQAETQADSVASDAPGLVADFNALLAKLKAAGIMA